MLKHRSKSTSNTEKVSSSGKMVPSTMGTGGTGWPRAKELFIMLTVMSIPVNSFKIELADSEYMFTPMARGTRAFGKMTCRTALAKRNLKMVPNTMECSKTVENGGKELITGQINLFILVTG